MTRLMIINGKGGVGKTTISDAGAIWLADHGYKVMLVSTDPAASVGDCLNQKIGKEPVEVLGVKNLTAVEIDGKYEWGKLHDYIREHNASGIDKFISREGVPGVNELAALFKVTMYMYDTRYDIIVVDTAPTGHTIDMLTLPDTMHSMMAGVKGMLSTWGVVKQFITGTGSQAAIDRIGILQTCVNHVKAVLTDPKTTHFNLVGEPNFMCMREEARSYNELLKQGIKARNMILNRIQPVCPCEWCTARRDQQDLYVKKIEDIFIPEGLGVIRVEQRAREIVGIDLLRQIGNVVMPQMAPSLDVQKAYRTRLSRDGNGLIVDTQMPYVEPEYLKLSIAGNILYLTVDYKLHEATTNALQFPKPVAGVQAVDNGGKLTLVVT